MATQFLCRLRLFAEVTFLYFLQGIPYGFQTKYLPLLMRQQGYELSRISFVNLVSLPWILKFTWAKLFGRFENHERFWISGGLLLLALTSLSFNLQTSTYGFLPALLLVMSFLSASLDIAVDALAIKCFEEKDLGYCNIGHVVGYKFGILFGGGVLTVYTSYLSLHHFNLFLSFVYLATSVYFFTANSQLFPLSSVKGGAEKEVVISQPSVQEIILQLTSSSQQMLLLLFVFFYKMGEQGFASMYPIKLIDEGEKLKNIGIVTGIIGQISSILGSTLGGIFISKFRIQFHALLFQVAILKWFVLMVFSYQLNLITSCFMLHCIIEGIFQLLAGIMTTVTFTTMMLSTKSLALGAQACHFAIFAAIEVLGKLWIKSFAGTLTEKIGYKSFFTFCGAMDSIMVCLAVLFFISHSQRQGKLKQK